MKTLFLCLFVSLAGMGCAQNAIKNEAPGPASQATGVSPQQKRITEERVLADRKSLDELQGRLRKLNESGIPQNNYPLAKAQCWLDTAKTQYHENDRTGYIEESMTESLKIIQALEVSKTAQAGFDTPLVARSARLRDDLWLDWANTKPMLLRYHATHAPLHAQRCASCAPAMPRSKPVGALLCRM
jgi:TolA-binding protein